MTTLRVINGGIDPEEYILKKKLKDYAKGCLKAGTDMDVVTLIMILQEHEEVAQRLVDDRQRIEILPNTFVRFSTRTQTQERTKDDSI
jgi:hypothetical protein